MKRIILLITPVSQGGPTARRRAVCLLLIVLIGLVFLGVPYAKDPPKPPPPPKKVLEDGSPWVPVDKRDALSRGREVPPPVEEVKIESPLVRSIRLGGDGPTLSDVTRQYMIMDSPLVNKKEDPFSDLYGSVRFMHLKHAALVDACIDCHHYRPKDPTAAETVRCIACHREAFDAETPGRPGLKAAYHRQCMGCHRERNQGPVGCTDCHDKHVPDHKTLVELTDNPSPAAVTKECLRCHDQAARGLLTAAHWRWRGPSPYTVGGKDRVDMGKATNTINNFCVALPSNWPRCTSCHAGYGWKDNNFDFSDKTKMDCLICHDTTGKYAKIPTAAGMPYPQLDLKHIAENVGRPDRKNCGDCHFQGGGGDAVKHGDMNSILYYPSRNCDVHMGGMDFDCIDCHETRNHKISGRSLSVPVAEGSRSCEDCHTATPHYYRKEEKQTGKKLLYHHLNRHTEHIHCQSCHSPVYSKCRPTKVWWDWSKAGDKNRKPKKDKYGMPDYSWKKGEFQWKESAVPTYAWYNGTVKRYLLGDTLDEDGLTEITDPVGEIWDPKSRIYPFKPMHGRQMADAKQDILLVPHLFGPGGYWKTLNWDKSFREGMEAAGLSYSGEYKWVETVMYWGLNHETMPAENALGCAQCHRSLTGDKTCDRCHQDNRNVDFKKITRLGTDFAFMKSRGRDVSDLIDKTDYLDFVSLGYKGDPILHGGRFKQLPLGKGTIEVDMQPDTN